MTPAHLLLLFFATASFTELSQQAAAAREGGRVKDAIRLYRASLQARPAWSQGWWYLGTLLYDENSFTAGREALTRLVKLEPKAAPGWEMLGLCEFETKDYANSLIHLERGLAIGQNGDPQLAKVTRFHAAMLLTLFGQYESAIQRFTELATSGGDDPQIIPAIGLAALRVPILPANTPPGKSELVSAAGRAVYDAALRRAADARKDFENLAATYPDTPEVHNLYGMFLLQSDPDRAIAEWKREIEISPKHVPARLQLAFEYLKRNEAATGLPYARQAAELELDSFVAHNALGRLLGETGDQKGAIVELERARDLAVDSPETRLALASAYAAAGRTQDAARERAEFQRLKSLSAH